MTPKNKQCWSYDRETFNHTSLSGLIDDLRGFMEDDEILGITVYQADATPPDAHLYVDANDIIEMLGERADDDLGECAEDWPDPSKEAIEKLNKFLRNWIKKECPASFWRVSNVKPYVITEEDLE